jgi:hypothetical protein
MRQRVQKDAQGQAPGLRPPAVAKRSLRANRLWLEACNGERPLWQRLALAPTAGLDFAARTAWARTLAPITGLVLAMSMGPPGLGLGFGVGTALADHVLDADTEGLARTMRRRAVRRGLQRVERFLADRDALRPAAQRELDALRGAIRQMKALGLRQPLRRVGALAAMHRRAHHAARREGR